MWFTSLILFLAETHLGKLYRRSPTAIRTRPRPVSFPWWPNWFQILCLPATDCWYHVRFYEVPDPTVPLPDGIHLERWSEVQDDIYALWLSPSQAFSLLHSNLAELARVEDKIVEVEGTVSLSEADRLVVQVAPVFDVNAFPSILFEPATQWGYFARSNDLKEAAEVLSKCSSVYSIGTPYYSQPRHNFDLETMPRENSGIPVECDLSKWFSDDDEGDDE
jgi:hypothetical protein